MPLHLNLPDKEAVKKSYMFFVQQGALFLPTTGNFEMGQTVDLEVQFLEQSELYIFSGKIIWVTPESAKGQKQPGIGVALSGEDGRHLRDQIETLLAGQLDGDKPSNTL